MPLSLVPRRTFVVFLATAASASAGAATRQQAAPVRADARSAVELRRGEVIGCVGTSGNASPAAPHLHFAVFRLGPERRCWKGEAVNPFGALH